MFILKHTASSWSPVNGPTKRQATGSGQWTSQRSVDLTEVSGLHRSLWTSQRSVDLTDVSGPHRGQWTSQRSVDLTEVGGPHRYQWTSQRSVDFTEVSGPHRGQWTSHQGGEEMHLQSFCVNISTTIHFLLHA